MSATHLTVVTTTNEPDTLAQRVSRLQAEARKMALDHVDMLRLALADVARLSAEIASGGDVYPVGPREIARRLATDAAYEANTLLSITERITH